MKPARVGFAVLAAFAGAAARADDPRVLPPDEPVMVNGIDVACTGVGETAQRDPRWRAYSVRIEFANADAEYLSDIELAVEQDGRVLFNVTCDSPWVLAKLVPGQYLAKARFEEFVKVVKLKAPKAGQARFVVRFPEVPGDRPK